MELIRVKDYEEMSAKACELVKELMNTVQSPVLGLATGSTPEGLYEKLIHTYENGAISFSNTKTFNLDEYVGLTKEDPNSYHYYMTEKLFKHVDLKEGNAHLPDGAAEDKSQACEDYERLIKSAGAIDLQLLGLGMNGHIGFNEPGTDFKSRTHIVTLDESTRQANARFFNSMDEVPTEAITMGIQSIMEARRVVLLVSGEKKAEALASLVNGEVTETFPASILQQHSDAVIIADEGACSQLR
ncbi:Glucosamine-6-phosphate deaminase [Lentibacillus sp. JNUCC-1]|uniref:glucosamine-6-phosphate deaminase n=1 Tax=Lentibacillus sp. JNUCC-1 TaxID=2654513 RepID=UPI0012E7E060|nr:glucosamine-6-phosphate deaminase [Lentibacillus sp. JNUCC-1]MUV39046.1 Glucosamine-6-phosphate deaminase [Lentibacillus sp. JNUCC-1]